MTQEQETTGMDDFTRRYLYVLLMVVFAGCVWWLSSLDFRAGAINKVLKADAELSSYEYQFRVISLKEGVAQVSSPRSAELPAIQSLRIMYPELQQSSVTSEEVKAAQDKLARMQSYAAELVTSQEGVTTVRWVLDRKWLAKHGVYVD